MKQVEVMTTPLNMPIPREKLEELISKQGFMLTGQIIVEDRPKIATAENPNATPSRGPVNVWVRNTAAIPAGYVAQVIIDLLAKHGEHEILAELPRLLFGMELEEIMDATK